jgi:hypothetical protein
MLPYWQMRRKGALPLNGLGAVPDYSLFALASSLRLLVSSALLIVTQPYLVSQTDQAAFLAQKDVLEVLKTLQVLIHVVVMMVVCGK